MTWTKIVQLCVIAITLRNVCCGLPEREHVQPDVCYRGNSDLELFDVYNVDNCFDACRARDWCTGFTMHAVMKYCRLHDGMNTAKEDCSGAGFLYSEKSSWQQKTLEGCHCSDGQTCNVATRECETTECPPPEPLENGQVLGNMRYVGAKVEYLCNHGYKRMGTGRSTCQANGTWSLVDNRPPSCAVVCPAVPPAGTNTIDPTADSRFPGTQIRYTCKAGHNATASSAMTLTCSDNGEWGHPPTCCPDSPCANIHVCFWTYFENTCYGLVNQQMNMSTAKITCAQLHTGAHLVDIKTKEEMDFLIKLYTTAHSTATNRVWTGAYSNNSESRESFLWTDGTRIVDGYHHTFKFTRIRSCVYIDPTINFVWDNAPCADSYWSVCEYKIHEFA